MELRKLGHHGIQIAPIVFGGNVFGWTADRKASFDLLDRFLDRGFETIDTADVYSAWVPGNSGGESETIVGEWMKARNRRDDVVLMTKVAKKADRRGLSEANIMAAIEESLRRLQTDFIDVYFAHEDDPDTPFEETLGAFAKLQKDGKVRSIGASNFEADRLAEAQRIAREANLPRYEVLQPEYNLVVRDRFEGALQRVAAAEDMGVVTYYALASGFLTGKYRTPADIGDAARKAAVSRVFDERGKKVLDTLLAIADEKSARPAQIAIAWLIASPGVTAPIVSARNVEQLEETLIASQIELTAEQMARLDAAGA